MNVETGVVSQVKTRPEAMGLMVATSNEAPLLAYSWLDGEDPKPGEEPRDTSDDPVRVSVQQVHGDRAADLVGVSVEGPAVGIAASPSSGLLAIQLDDGGIMIKEVAL